MRPVRGRHALLKGLAAPIEDLRAPLRGFGPKSATLKSPGWRRKRKKNSGLPEQHINLYIITLLTLRVTFSLLLASLRMYVLRCYADA